MDFIILDPREVIIAMTTDKKNLRISFQEVGFDLGVGKGH